MILLCMIQRVAMSSYWRIMGQSVRLMAMCYINATNYIEILVNKKWLSYTKYLIQFSAISISIYRERVEEEGGSRKEKERERDDCYYFSSFK